MKRSILSAVLLAAALAGAEGKPAPDVKFTAQDGKAVNLADYRGKKSVVLLFQRGFADGFACYYCGEQTKSYKAEYEKLKAAGAEVLMVLPGAKDPAGYLKAIGEADGDHPDPKFSVPFPVVLDADFSACKAFGVPFDLKESGLPVSKPATIIIAKDGTIAYEYHGKAPDDRPEVAAVLAVLTGGAAPDPKKTESPSNLPTLAWVGYDDALKAAKEQKKPLLLDFYADW